MLGPAAPRLREPTPRWNPALLQQAPLLRSRGCCDRRCSNRRWRYGDRCCCHSDRCWRCQVRQPALVQLRQVLLQPALVATATGAGAAAGAGVGVLVATICVCAAGATGSLLFCGAAGVVEAMF